MANLKEITENAINYNYEMFTNYLIPFGSLDIRTAIKTALQVGEDGEWAAEQIEEFAESCGININEVDPVYCVYYCVCVYARYSPNLLYCVYCVAGGYFCCCWTIC